MIDYTCIDIAELIPHSGKMILIDRILSYDENSLSAELTVRSDALLGSERMLPAWVGIEYMAQAIAAYAGIMAKSNGEQVRLGFLLGTRRYSGNTSEFEAGSKLTVRVEKIMHEDELGVFDCRIECGSIIVQALLNVYQPPSNELTF